MFSVLPGCLVTDSVDFEAPVNHPPTFVRRPGADLDNGDMKFVRNLGVPSWPFSLRVRDEDVNQDLEVRWRIVTRAAGSSNREIIALPARGELTRDFDLVIQSGQLSTDSCHRIDIAVSGSFAGRVDDPTVFDVVTDPDDIAYFNFTIFEGQPNSNDPAKLIETCPTEVVDQPMATTGAAGESGP